MNLIRVRIKLAALTIVFSQCLLATILSAQTIITQPTNQVVLIGSNVTFAVIISESDIFSYQWQFNGSNIPNNAITTVAGSGSGGQLAGTFSGDGGAATNAGLNYPDGVAVDSKGNVFIGDLRNHRVRKVDTNGIINTIAGNGVQGSAGDGGTATDANLNNPQGVALDTASNLFIAQFACVRKVNANGIISTVTNSSAYGSCLDVAADSFGNVFAAYNGGLVVKFNSNGVSRIVAGGGTNHNSNIQATNASLSSPSSIALDALGNLFICDRQTYCIYKINTNNIINIIAGIYNRSGFSGDGGAATNANLDHQNGLDIDTHGNLFIADTENHRIRMVDTNGIITTVAGGGVGNFTEGPAYFQYPQAVALDTAGNLFVADMWNQRVRKVAFAGFPTLTINSAATNNAGNYSVIITGASGSVTSSIVSLVVTGTPPSVTIQPNSQSVTVGASITFSANATGTPPFLYQWKFNGTNINGATDSTLSLNNVFPTNAGTFSVAVTNAWGGVVSDAATLSVFSIPIVSPHFIGNGQFQFGLDTTIGVNYTIEYSTNLYEWFSLLTIGGSGSTITVTDPNAFSFQRYYRAVLSP